MRPLLIVLAGLCASTATSLAVYAAVQLERKPYVEVLQGGLVRTTAEDFVLSCSVSHVLHVNRSPAATPEEQLEKADYHEHGDVWFSKPDLFGQATERASRMVRRQLDRTGRELQIEVLQGEGMPTLVFVHHDDQEAANRVARHLAIELAENGVKLMN
ncbi:hypothetical protein [Botrimarina mediterranea]|uniref:Uncharacterized protein n=1 Tax=Botrimarina mediterranea TaxID=2528022 RepID=A0A518KF64_9BACT|nr:hypothetical protein [Botrimarina mediterranea]QDV76412.1 hypothetical protein Spa11_46420 [Botrimarina mediterranea]QDV81008.1 hypothetical protein K2D_46430 [Planctomycetes bacterium K2D]